MSENWDIDLDHEDFEDAPRALRDAYKNLKKKFDSVTTERDDFRGKWQKVATRDALKDYGFKNSSRVSRDLLADGVDISDPNAVKVWVEENGDDYARSQSDPSADPGQVDEHDAEAAARQQLQSTTNGGQPPNMDKWAAVQSMITPDMDGAAVQRLYQQHGI